MRNKQPATDVGMKPSIEAFALPSELRRAHNFSSRTRPIIGLDLPSTPPPLRRPAPPSPPWVSDRDTAPPVAMPETDFLIESRLGDQDPPLNLPASWREAPKPTPRKRSGWHWSERSTAAFSGFAGGLLIVVPLVFMLGGNAAHAPSSLTLSSPLNFSFAATSAYLEKLWRSDEPAAAEAIAEPAQEAAATQRQDLIAAEAEAKVDLAEGRIEAARSKLRAVASPENAHVWFLLAETYDPNQTRQMATADAEGGGSLEQPAADAEFARYYYRQAMTHGVETARTRLEALRPER